MTVAYSSYNLFCNLRLQNINTWYPEKQSRRWWFSHQFTGQFSKISITTIKRSFLKSVACTKGRNIWIKSNWIQNSKIRFSYCGEICKEFWKNYCFKRKTLALPVFCFDLEEVKTIYCHQWTKWLIYCQLVTLYFRLL